MICKLCGSDEVPNHKCSLLDDIKAHQEWEQKMDKKARTVNVGLTPYPHNMTKVQWRKMMAAMAMGKYIEREEVLFKAHTTITDKELVLKRMAVKCFRTADAMLAEGDKTDE